MLQEVRERIQGWIASVIIGLLAVTFALWGIQSYIGGSAGPGKVAKVNGKEITTGELDAAYGRLRQNLQARSQNSQPLNEAAQVALKQQALQQLITMQVLSSAAKKKGYFIGATQLDNFILQMPAFQEQGNFSPQKFQQTLNILGYAPEQFMADLESTLLIGQIQLGTQSTAFGLPNEAQQALKLADQKRDIQYTIIPAAKFQKSAVVSDDAIKNYYQQHQDQFRVPEKVSIEYIELSVDQIAKNLQISPQESQQYYQDNLANFTKDGKTLPFETVKNEVNKALTQQKLQQTFSDQSQQLSDLTYTNSTSLTPAANALNLKIQTSDSFTRAGDKAGITANPQVVAAAFNEDVVKNSNNSNPIPIKDGDVIVLRMKDYQPATVLPLPSIKDKIIAVLETQAAQNAAEQSGQKIITALKAGNFQEISQQNNLSWQTKMAATRQTPGLSGEILRTAFALPQPNNEKLTVAGIVLANGDYALVAVNKVIDVDVTNAKQQEHVMQNEIENSYGQLEYQLYVDDLLQRAKIKIYKQS